jgi:hypothetical protein
MKKTLQTKPVIWIIAGIVIIGIAAMIYMNYYAAPQPLDLQGTEGIATSATAGGLNE